MRSTLTPDPSPIRWARVAFQLGALGGEADFGEAQEDVAEDGRGVFLGLEAGVGAELVRGIPEAFFQRGVVGVLFGWGDPDHVVSFIATRGIPTIPTARDGLMTGFMVAGGSLLWFDFGSWLRPFMALRCGRSKAANTIRFPAVTGIGFFQPPLAQNLSMRTPRPGG